MVRTFRLLAPITLAGGLFLLTLATLAACGQAGPKESAPTPTQVAGEVALPASPTATPQFSDIAAVGPTPTPTPSGEQPQYGGAWTWSRGGGNAAADPWAVITGFGLPTYVFWNGLIQQRFPFEPSKGVEFEPYLATAYSQSEDGSKWRFKLRQGVTFHDGEVFNADDVVATVQRLLDPEFLVYPEQVAMRKVFVGVKKIDDYTVELDTGQPDSTTFAFLTNYLFVMMPDHLIRGEDPSSSDVNKRWRILHPNKAGGPNYTGTLGIGTGPWKMTKLDPQVETAGERNPNYFNFDQYGNRLPYMDKWRQVVVPDGVRRLARFVAGADEFTLGTASGMHPNQAKALCAQTKEKDCYSELMPHGWFTQMLNPVSTAPFKDPKVVQAARYSQDMDEIFRIAYGGRQGYMWMDRGRYPETALTVKEQYEVLPWSNPARRPEFFQKAKDLIVEAGYPKGIDLPLPIFSNGLCTGSFLDQYSRHVDAYSRVGIQGILECRQGVVVRDELRGGKWSINGPGTPHLLDPGVALILYALLDSAPLSGAPWQWEGQVELDVRYRKTTKTVDPARRNELYKDMERYMANSNLHHFAGGYSVVYYSAHGCVRDFHLGGIWQSHMWSMERAWLEPNSKCRE